MNNGTISVEEGRDWGALCPTRSASRALCRLFCRIRRPRPADNNTGRKKRTDSAAQPEWRPDCAWTRLCDRLTTLCVYMRKDGAAQSITLILFFGLKNHFYACNDATQKNEAEKAVI